MSKLIPLRGKYGEGRFAIVDDCDFERLNQYKWCLDSKGYPARARRDSDGNGSALIRIHHMILPAREGFFRDHKNRNPLDNRRSNLRHATNAQNITNTSPRSNGTSRYVGVNYNKNSKKWHARIGYKNKVIHLGFYATEEEAARVRDGAALFYHGEFAIINMP